MKLPAFLRSRARGRASTALFAVWLTSTGARAEGANSAGTVGAFYPAALSDHTARDQASARELERMLGALSGVEQAHVAWTRPDPSLAPLDQPLTEANLTILLQILGTGPSQEALDAVLGNLLAAETPRPSIRVLKKVAAHSARSPTHYETNESPLRTVLAVSLAANVLLATVLLLRARARA